MKLYNIRESKRFFEKLSTCRGKVEIINNEGRPIVLKDADTMSEDSPLFCYNGTIPQIELKFEYTADLEKILSYILSFNRIA